MGAVPLHVPGLAVRVSFTTALPVMVGGEVLVGAVAVVPLDTTMLSATIVKAWAAELFPICTALMPVDETVAVAEWYTTVPLTETSTVPVAEPVVTTWTWSWAQVLSASVANAAL